MTPEVGADGSINDKPGAYVLCDETASCNMKLQVASLVRMHITGTTFLSFTVNVRSVS